MLLHISIGNLDWNEGHENETKRIHASVADWCKCMHCKNEARKIDFLCCREVNSMFIALTKITEREGSI